MSLAKVCQGEWLEYVGIQSIEEKRGPSTICDEHLEVQVTILSANLIKLILETSQTQNLI